MASVSAKPAKAMEERKMTPAEVVMRSIESGRNATAMGDLEQAVRILKSVDELCKRSEAPPTVHGLGLRVLSDALLLNGQLDEARDALTEGVKMNEAALKREGLPEFLRLDVSARLGDLCAALGELERQCQNWKEALRALRKAADYFEAIGSAQHFQTATLNRVGFCLIEKKDFKDALAELKEAAIKAETIPEEEPKNALLGANYRHQGLALAGLGDDAGATSMYNQALTLAVQVGDPDLVAELNDKLNLGQEHAHEASPGEDAFL